MTPRTRPAAGRCGMALLVALAVATAAAPAQGGDDAFPVPNFSKRLFDIDSVFLEPHEVVCMNEALAAVAANFPDTPKITNSLRAKALAVSLRVDGVHRPSAIALEKLTAGEQPDPVDGYDSPDEVAKTLWELAEVLDVSDASADDHLLACYLMDIAARIDPGREGGLERFQRLSLKGDFHGWRGVLPGTGRPGFQFPRDPGTGGGPDPGPDPGPAPEPVDAPPAKLVKTEASGRVLLLDPRGRPPRGAVSALQATTIVGSLENPMAVRFLDVDGQEIEGLERVSAFVPPAVAASGTRWPNNGGSMTVSVEAYYDPLNGEGIGLSTALLARSLLTGEEFGEDVAVVGGIGEDSKVLPVSALLPRLRELNPAVAPVVVLPEANVPQLIDLAVLGDLKPFINHQIFAVDDLKSAAMVAFEQPEAVVNARRLFAEIQELALTMPAGDLAANSKVRERLAEIVADVPTHASAKLMLLAGRRELPERLSPEGSVYVLEQAAAPVMRVMDSGGEPFVDNPARLFATTRSRIADVRPKLDRSCVSAADLLVDLVAKIEEYSKLNNRESTQGQALLEEVRSTWAELRKAYRALRGPEGEAPPSAPPRGDRPGRGERGERPGGMRLKLRPAGTGGDGGPGRPRDRDEP